MGYAIDLEGRLRARPPSIGAYEHGGDVPDAGVPIDAAVVSPPGADAAGSSDAASDALDGGRLDAGSGPATSGCACRATQRELPIAPTALVSLALLAAARRRARGQKY
jgi:hypothetical protein